jgi:hypothetical protein
MNMSAVAERTISAGVTILADTKNIQGFSSLRCQMPKHWKVVMVRFDNSLSRHHFTVSGLRVGEKRLLKKLLNKSGARFKME